MASQQGMANTITQKTKESVMHARRSKGAQLKLTLAGRKHAEENRPKFLPPNEAKKNINKLKWCRGNKKIHSIERCSIIKKVPAVGYQCRRKRTFEKPAAAACLNFDIPCFPLEQQNEINCIRLGSTGKKKETLPSLVVPVITISAAIRIHPPLYSQ